MVYKLLKHLRNFNWNLKEVIVNENVNDVNEAFLNSIDDTNMFYINPPDRKPNIPKYLAVTPPIVKEKPKKKQEPNFW